MFNRLRVWWYEKRLRSSVNSLIFHTQEFYEWRDRFIPENNEEEALKAYWTRHCVQRGNEAGQYLKYNLRVPTDQWVRYDDNQEMYLYYERNAQINYRVELRDKETV